MWNTGCAGTVASGEVEGIYLLDVGKNALQEGLL